MASIMRVTSRSESENSFFDRFLTPHATPVEFWMSFEIQLEKHAPEIYTPATFKDFQNELCAAVYNCGMVDVHVTDGTEVLKHKNIRRIPDKYILNRWTKNALMKPVFDKHDNKMEDVGKSDNKKRMTNELWEEMYSCVSLAEENEKDIQMLIDKLRELKMEIKQRANNPQHDVGNGEKSRI
ncbi:uncharacterized protein LOC141607459 [Silene latifolia]|uniref:uncharacterized protein LOC141607459 n=1 Tax=Silene latifolia TaxID=37657 RepID=UPI003D771B4A